MVVNVRIMLLDGREGLLLCSWDCGNDPCEGHGASSRQCTLSNYISATNRLLDNCPLPAVRTSSFCGIQVATSRKMSNLRDVSLLTHITCRRILNRPIY